MIMTAQLMALGDIILLPFGISQLLVLLKTYSEPMLLKVTLISHPGLISNIMQL